MLVFKVFEHFSSKAYESLLAVRIHFVDYHSFVYFDDEDSSPNMLHSNISYISMNDKNIDPYLNIVAHWHRHTTHYRTDMDRFESKIQMNRFVNDNIQYQCRRTTLQNLSHSISR
jgi:hypothetical protein